MSPTLIMTLLLAIWVPQNRTEFIDAVAAGKGATAMQTVTVNRTFEQVYMTLEAKSAECLDVVVERTANVGYVEVSSSDYNPKLERVGKGTAAFSLQVVHRPRAVGATPPPDGLFLMAADIKAVDEEHTQIVLYHPTIGFKKVVTSFKGWLEGTETGCPKMR